MRWICVGLVAFLAAVPAAGGAMAAEPLKAQAESSVEVSQDGDVVSVHSVNRGFQWLGLFDRERDGYRHLILEKTEEGTVSNGAEGTAGAKVRLQVSEYDGDELEPLFTIEDDGEAGQLDSFAWSDAYFTTVRFGCCGALDTRHTYSLLNGRLLFTSTAAPAWFEVPNSGGLVRIAAVHTVFSTEDDTIFGQREDALATLTYASPEAPLQRFLITTNGQLAGEDLEYPDPVLGWTEGDSAPASNYEVWSADGAKDLSGVQNLVLVVSMAPKLEIRLPLVEGRLALEQATLPKGLGLEAMDLP